MPPPPDQLIERVLRLLAAAPVQGLSIAELFAQLDHHAVSQDDQALDDRTKTLIWESLISREDISFGEGASATALKKLSLDDILGLGLGGRTLRLLVPVGAGQGSNATPNSQAIEVAVTSSNDTAVPKETLSEPGNHKNDASEPKRRGRPPRKLTKKQPETLHSPTGLASNPQRNSSVLNRGSPQPEENPVWPEPEATPQTIASAPSSRPVTPLESKNSPDATLQQGQTPSSKHTNSLLGYSAKKAKFTPYEEIQREEDDAKIKAGISGVYINPTVGLLPDIQLGRTVKRRMVAVFKSSQLKISQWLDARKGTWVEEFQKRTGKEHDVVILNGPVANPDHGNPPLKVKPHQDGSMHHASGSISQPTIHSGTPQQPSYVQAQHHTPQQPAPLQFSHGNVQQQHRYSPYGPSPQQVWARRPSPETQRNIQPNIPSLSRQTSPHQLPNYYVSPQSSYQPLYPAHEHSYNTFPAIAPRPRPILPQPPPAPAYISPYRSPYQPLNPSPSSQSLAISQSQNIQNTVKTTIELPSSLRQNEFKPESPGTPVQELDTKSKRIGKRKAIEDSNGAPGKRRKSLEATPASIVPVSGTTPPQTSVATSAIVPTIVPDPLLGAILKQQEEEKAKEAQRERELQNKLSAADIAQVPDHLVRLAASHNGMVGNLLLSENQSTLSFLSNEQPQLDSPKLVLEISAVSENPAISIPGSKPVQLSVKTKDDSDEETIHHFGIGPLESARNSADVMRAKIVLARINIRGVTSKLPNLSDEEVDDAQLAIRKPFLCEKCGKRFKNREGILYHKTKSQTSCNPNFDVSTVRPPRVWARGPKKKKVTIVEPSRKTERKQDAQDELAAGSEQKEEAEGEEEQSSSDSSDSLDSVIEWAEKASRQKKRFTSSRRRKGSSKDPSANKSDEEAVLASRQSNDEGSDGISVISVDDDDDEYDNIENEYHPKSKFARHRSRAMQDRWARVKAVGANKLTGDADLEELVTQMYKPSTSKRKIAQAQSPIERSPIVEMELEERERPAPVAPRDPRCWNTAASLLPNPKDGAWNQSPHRARIPRKIVRRFELPEPVTYMQSVDGAWSIRPFGHGVKPIYARPSRRADGNPSLPNYLKRLENGFRPVVMPTKNRLFLPAMPAKRLLEDPTSYVSPSSAESVEAANKRRRLGDILAEEEEKKIPLVRISKSTGKPVRPYRRGYDPVSKGARTRRQNGDIGQDMDSVHTLGSLEPKSLDAVKGRMSNPGLESLPVYFGLAFSRRDIQEVPIITEKQNNQHLQEQIPEGFSIGDIVSEEPNQAEPPVLWGVDQVAAWEQGAGSEFLSSGTLQPEYRWINHTVDSLEGAADLEHVKIAWDKERSFEMTTIPYAQLDQVEDTPIFDTPLAMKAPIKPASRAARELRQLHKGWTTRRLTALESDLAGLGDSIEKVAKEMRTQVAPARTVQRVGYGDATMSTADEARLVVGVCVIRTLTGGLDQNIDWVLVYTLFRTYSMNFLTKRWTTLYQKKRVAVEKLVSDFQELFLKAYKNDEVPPLDYDNLVAYDWNWLIDWVMKKLDVSLESKSIELPATREQLDKLYFVKEQNDDNSRQEGFFSLTHPVYKRMDLASSVANAYPSTAPPEAHHPEDSKMGTFTIVKSWVRAAALTPDEDWNPQTLKRMLKSLNNPNRQDSKGNDPVIKKLVDDAGEALKNEKVLMQKNKGRVSPQRSYEPTDLFFSGLRKHVTVQQFREAAEYKCFLDQEFKSGVSCVRSDYLANEGMLMCLTHLQANGRIRMRPIGVPMEKFGLGEGSYETRKIPKEKFRFDMDIYPTAKYIYDADIEVMQHLKSVEPPRGSELGELPVWYGIGDRLIVPLWHRVLVAFAGILALRAGSGVAGLKKIFKPTLEEWEIERLLEWGVEHGVFQRLHEVVGGWTTGEWWWLIVGWCCAGEG